MESITSVLKRIGQGNPRFREALALAKLMQLWPKAAGEQLANYAEVTEYRHKVLFIEALSPLWAQQIHFYRQMLLSKYKELAPEIQIYDLKTQAGKMKLNPVTIEAKKQTCPICGEEHGGTKIICGKCQEKERLTRIAKVSKYLEEAPWSKYQDLCKQEPFPEQEYHLIKEQLINKLTDQVNSLYYEVLNKKQNKETLKRKALNLVLLKTGLTPGQINDNIVKTMLSAKLVKLIYKKQ